MKYQTRKVMLEIAEGCDVVYYPYKTATVDGEAIDNLQEYSGDDVEELKKLLCAASKKVYHRWEGGEVDKKMAVAPDDYICFRIGERGMMFVGTTVIIGDKPIIK